MSKIFTFFCFMHVKWFPSITWSTPYGAAELATQCGGGREFMVRRRTKPESPERSCHLRVVGALVLGVLVVYKKMLVA